MKRLSLISSRPLAHQLWGAALTFLLLATEPASAGIEAFLQFNSPSGTLPVEGETKDAHFAKLKAVEILGFSCGIEKAITIGSSGAATGERAKLKKFSIRKALDRASPPLFLSAGSGGYFEQVTLFLRKSGTTDIFAVFTFQQAYVTSMEWAASTADDRPAEEVVFEYVALKVEYKPETATGELGDPIAGKWNQVTNNESFDSP